MTSIEIRHLALEYAVRDSLTYTSSPAADPASIVARATAYEAYLAGAESPAPAEQLADWEKELLYPEPPIGSVVVLRSATTGVLLSAQRKVYAGEPVAWHEFDVLAARSWDDLIAGRDIVAVHTPDGA